MSEETLTLSDSLRSRLDRLGLEFVAEVLGIETRERPGNAEALVTLGMVLTQLGRYPEGLAVDRRLVELHPKDSGARYNLACSLALTGQCALALSALEEAGELGYDDAEHLVADADLSSLRNEARYLSVIARLRKHA